MSRSTEWLLAGGVVVGAIAWTRRDARQARSARGQLDPRALSTRVADEAAAANSATAEQIEHARRARVCGDPTLPTFGLPGRWVWPLAMWNGRAPVCSDGWGSARTKPDGKPSIHLGVDLMYRRASRADLAEHFPPGTRGGSRWHVMPADVQALAASAGTVRYAKWTARGFTVVIDHLAPWATYYTHLSMLSVRPGQTVVAGEPIGFVGGDPSKPPHLRHLHFALWRGQWQDAAVNPAPLMASWDVLSAPIRPSRAVA